MAVKKRAKSLAAGRPPISRRKDRMTSERSRTIINTHHRLHKEHAAALRKGDVKAAQLLEIEIEKNGGIKLYQAASKQGQAKDRGGDSSKVLIDWLQQSQVIDRSRNNKELQVAPLRCLEVGALSSTNEISKFPKSIHMTRIDLNSQGAGIDKQDFMERPLPDSKEDQFDIISLSLVLNYVPDAQGRGEMLKRLTKFLRSPNPSTTQSASMVPLPILFFVLPRPCVDNSRYLDEKLLLQIFHSLGFTMQHNKHTSKLSYYLFSRTGPHVVSRFDKKKIRDGPGMNNFSIIVE